MSQTQYNFNKRLANVTLVERNDGIRDTKIDIHCKLHVAIRNIYISLEIRMPDKINDKNFSRSVFRSNINVAKALGGLSGNFVIDHMFRRLTGNAKTNPQFPMKMVS